MPTNDPQSPQDERKSGRRSPWLKRLILVLAGVGVLLAVHVLFIRPLLLIDKGPHPRMWERARQEAKSYDLKLELDGLVVDGQGVPIPDAKVHLTVDEWTPSTSNWLPFEEVRHQKTTDAAGRFSYRGKGYKIRVERIEGPDQWLYGEWLYDLDVGHYVVGEPNRSNAIYQSDWGHVTPYRAKAGSPAVFVMAHKGQPISVMPQRGGIEAYGQNNVMESGPVFPRKPSVPLTTDPVMRGDRETPWWTPGSNKADMADKIQTLERELIQRIRNCAPLLAMTGPLQDIESPSWRYEHRNIGNKHYWRLRTKGSFDVNSVRVKVEVVVHLTPEGFRPVTLQVRPRTRNQQPPIPLWTQDEIAKGLALFQGTEAQRDALFDGWETDPRATINVIAWMKITRPVILPFETD